MELSAVSVGRDVAARREKMAANMASCNVRQALTAAGDIATKNIENRACYVSTTCEDDIININYN